MKSRDKFEKWFIDMVLAQDLCNREEAMIYLKKNTDDEYVFETTAIRWDAWQASETQFVRVGKHITVFGGCEARFNAKGKRLKSGGVPLFAIVN
jgi:hypothetical protein